MISRIFRFFTLTNVINTMITFRTGDFCAKSWNLSVNCGQQKIAILKNNDSQLIYAYETRYRFTVLSLSALDIS
jgi:hypothetical protein